MDDAFRRLANALEPPPRRLSSSVPVIDATLVAESAPPPVPRRPRGDTSRDRAHYAAPHRPSATPPLARRTTDVTTRRILREVRAAAATAPRGLGALTIAFLVTVGLGLAGISAAAFLR